MDRGRVGEDRGSKETDGCPLTGVIISHNKVEMNLGVADWPMTSNKKEVQSFINFINFY
jgi:hypothetical protein